MGICHQGRDGRERGTEGRTRVVQQAQRAQQAQHQGGYWRGAAGETGETAGGGHLLLVGTDLEGGRRVGKREGGGGRDWSERGTRQSAGKAAPGDRAGERTATRRVRQSRTGREKECAGRRRGPFRVRRAAVQRPPRPRHPAGDSARLLRLLHLLRLLRQFRSLLLMRLSCQLHLCSHYTFCIVVAVAPCVCRARCAC